MRSFRGTYKPLNFPFPTNSLIPAPAAAGPMLAAAATTSQAIRGGRRAGMGDAASDAAPANPLSGVMSWIQNNAGTALAIGLGVIILPNMLLARGRR